MAKGQKQKPPKEEKQEVTEVPQAEGANHLFDSEPAKVSEEALIAEINIEVVGNVEPTAIIIQDSGIEPEEDFLRRILQIQEEGGWGNHLHPIIKERLKQLGK